MPSKRNAGRPKKKTRKMSSSKMHSSKNVSVDYPSLNDSPNLTILSSSGIPSHHISNDGGIYQLLLDLSGEFRILGGQVGALNRRLEDILEKVTDLEVKNKDLHNKLKDREETVCKLQDRVDELEKKERSNHILISSPDIDQMESANFKNIMVDKLASTLHLPPTTLSQFSYRKIGQQRKRKALVTVRCPEERTQFFVAARTVKPRNFFVNESLLKSRDRLFYEVRNLRRTSGSRFLVYSYYGEIYIKLNRESKPNLVRSIDDVRIIVGDI